MFVITGATGNLGTHVLEQLVDRVGAERVRAAVRTPEKAARWTALGVDVVKADYDDPGSLLEAFRGAERVLLISSSAVGQRARQHRNVVDAAKANGVELLVYTSLLNAETSNLLLAEEHQVTEADIRSSGLRYTLLRNGWYTENYVGALPGVLSTGSWFGAAGEGRVSTATREDYAAAAVVALTEDGHVGKTYELAGSSFTLSDLAAFVSDKTQRPLPYVDLEQGALEEALMSAGVPAPFAHVLADADAGIARGDLYSDRNDLADLLGRSPTPWQTTITAALDARG